MNKIYPILTCDVCCAKGIIRTCPLEKCQYRMCMSCRNTYDSNLCPLCRRELPSDTKKCICQRFNIYLIKKYIRFCFVLFCNIDTSIPIRKCTDLIIIFLKLILFVLKLAFFIIFMCACRALSELQIHCDVFDACQQTFFCDNVIIFTLLCIYGFILLCLYVLLILFCLLAVLMYIDYFCCKTLYFD